MFRPFLIALQFLTVLPIRFDGPPEAEESGRSLLYYPLIGLIIGMLLAVLAWMLSRVSASLSAAVLLTVWVAATGALHLDGLADSADAWLGGLGDRDRTLEIMKDPCCGPAAVVALILVLLIKFAALTSLVTEGNWDIIVLTPVVGRIALVLLFLTTAYVRPKGIGSLLAKHLPRRVGMFVVMATLVIVAASIGLTASWLLIAAAGVFLTLRRSMLRRLGGTTGDTAGALLEITETVALLTAALVI